MRHDNALVCRHKEDMRCGFYRPGMTVRVSLSWDSVTCPECLALKRENEPWHVEIDTRGD